MYYFKVYHHWFSPTLVSRLRSFYYELLLLPPNTTPQPAGHRRVIELHRRVEWAWRHPPPATGGSEAGDNVDFFLPLSCRRFDDFSESSRERARAPTAACWRERWRRARAAPARRPYRPGSAPDGHPRTKTPDPTVLGIVAALFSPLPLHTLRSADARRMWGEGNMPFIRNHAAVTSPHSRHVDLLF